VRKNGGDTIDFIGSLNEQTGFTCLLYDAENQEVTIKKDVEGLKLSHSFPALDILLMTGDDRSVFDQYRLQMGIELPKVEPATGWTSWYNHYTNISEKIILDNLAVFEKRNLPIDFFQIDDGWATRIGDWLSVKPSFPNGMKPVAQKIQAAGFKAGLWLAPLIVEQKSRIFKEKPEWLLRDTHGKLVPAGFSPHWSGWLNGRFFVLDFYKKEVQEWLSGVFFTILNTWGYDMVKLDFLYAACIVPQNGKTRGQVMHDIMDFFRRVAGEKIILACGVPLASAFGKVEFCRIGADIHMAWDHQQLAFLKNRERVSTWVSLRTTLGRWQLNNRFFHSDPDVFILRKDNNQLTDTQRATIFMVNTLLGNLLFCSDDLSAYPPETMVEYKKIFTAFERQILKIQIVQNDVYAIHFRAGEKNSVCYVNLNPKPVRIESGKQLAAFASEIF
jgi:alpha-galactosidase